MKRNRGEVSLAIVFFLAMMLLPLLALGGAKKQTGQGKAAPKASATQFRVKDLSTQRILTVDDEDFVTATVATELSPEAPAEALKAQAVAARTYYGRLRRQSRASAGEESDFEVESYLTPEKMKQRWGASYDKYYAAVHGAAAATAGQVLRYDGALADTTYFAISPGQTEDAQDVWGGKCAYLVSVASPGDAFAGGYQTEAAFSDEDFRSRVLKAAPKANLSGPAESWIGTAVCTQAGTVKTVAVGGETLTGGQMRQALGLRSAAFTAQHTKDGFRFTVRGYGHGVGMSQVGAESMARQGAGYREILAWYYPGTALGA